MFPAIIEALPVFDWHEMEPLPRGLHRAETVYEPSYTEAPIYYATGRNSLPRDMGSLISYGAGKFAWFRSSFFDTAPKTAKRATLELIGQLVLSVSEVREISVI